MKAPSKAKAVARRAPARASRTPATPSSRAAAPGKGAKRKPAAARSSPKAKRIRATPALPIALVAGVLALGWFLYPMARLHYTEQRKVERLQAQLASIQERNSTLKAEVEKLKTPQGVEEAARELGLSRPGEQLWVTVEDGRVTSVPATASPVRAADAVPEAPWTTRALDVIFGVGP